MSVAREASGRQMTTVPAALCRAGGDGGTAQAVALGEKRSTK